MEKHNNLSIDDLRVLCVPAHSTHSVTFIQRNGARVSSPQGCRATGLATKQPGNTGELILLCLLGCQHCSQTVFQPLEKGAALRRLSINLANRTNSPETTHRPRAQQHITSVPKEFRGNPEGMNRWERLL